MATLTSGEIRKRLTSRDGKRLIVSPLLRRDQVRDMSIDLRIGNQFIIFRRHTQGEINPFTISKEGLHRFQERRIVPFCSQSFVLHPGVLALAATFEYVRLPNDLEGQVEGRSSWARLGLQIATATCVEPGFSGVITFELSNIGNMPLPIYPGVRVAQMILRETLSAVEKPHSESGKYQFAIGPQFSRLNMDADALPFIPEDVRQRGNS
jgi:dCTP deaminase